MLLNMNIRKMYHIHNLSHHMYLKNNNPFKVHKINGNFRVIILPITLNNLFIRVEIKTTKLNKLTIPT